MSHALVITGPAGISPSMPFFPLAMESSESSPAFSAPALGGHIDAPSPLFDFYRQGATCGIDYPTGPDVTVVVATVSVELTAATVFNAMCQETDALRAQVADLDHANGCLASMVGEKDTELEKVRAQLSLARNALKLVKMSKDIFAARTIAHTALGATA